MCRTRYLWREAAVASEEMGKCSWRTRRGRGASTFTKMAEIMSGRPSNQQGLAATCKDRAHKGRSEALGGCWSGAWARRSDEGGVMSSEMVREIIWQRGPGHSVATMTPGRTWTQMPGFTRPGNRRRGDWQTERWRGECGRALKHRRASGRLVPGRPRSESDSGNPTVRDRSGICGNVNYGSRTEAYGEIHRETVGP